MQWHEYVETRMAGRQQVDVADLVGVSQGTISRWRAGKSEPSVENVILFARAVGDSPVAALLTFGFLRRNEVEQVVHLEASLADLDAGALLAELGRRLGVTKDGRRRGA